jgi:hypothetical protein
MPFQGVPTSTIGGCGSFVRVGLVWSYFCGFGFRVLAPKLFPTRAFQYVASVSLFGP